MSTCHTCHWKGGGESVDHCFHAFSNMGIETTRLRAGLCGECADFETSYAVHSRKIDELQNTIQTLTQERDAAHNAALEEAAVMLRTNAEVESPRNGNVMIQCGDAIRALKR